MRFWKRLVVLFVIIQVFSIFAAAESGHTEVFVTKTGEKYHRRHCYYLAIEDVSGMPVTLYDAVSLDYEPCEKCDPPILTYSSEAATTNDELRTRLAWYQKNYVSPIVVERKLKLQAKEYDEIISGYTDEIVLKDGQLTDLTVKLSSTKTATIVLSVALVLFCPACFIAGTVFRKKKAGKPIIEKKPKPMKRIRKAKREPGSMDMMEFFSLYSKADSDVRKDMMEALKIMGTQNKEG